MNPILITGTMIVTVALVFYSVSVIAEQRRQVFTLPILVTRTIGVGLDITATAFMIAGSRNIPFTVHGLLGYSALAGMLVDTILVWRHWKSAKNSRAVPQNLRWYTRFAYLWWVFAYLAGGLIAAFVVRQ